MLKIETVEIKIAKTKLVLELTEAQRGALERINRKYRRETEKLETVTSIFEDALRDLNNAGVEFNEAMDDLENEVVALLSKDMQTLLDQARASEDDEFGLTVDSLDYTLHTGEYLSRMEEVEVDVNMPTEYNSTLAALAALADRELEIEIK